MNQYRVTIRFGSRRSQYRVLDVEAATLREALRRVVEDFPAEAEATADLIEVRRQVDPEARAYTPG
ncbi:MAG: hypothetical protein DIU52_009950 [bacterium]|jgi:hypothetical protein|nr:MAG: hypothetical protein DIU52_10250 [bacterium]